MKNIIKNGILFIAVAVFLFNTNDAFAYVPGVWDPQPRVQTNEAGFYKVPMPFDAPVVPQTNSTSNNTVTNTERVVATNNTTRTTNTVRTTTPTRVVNNTATANRGNTITTPADVRELPPVVTIDQGTSTNDLAALSLAGTGGFMPSSVWQWLFVILLILAVIILFRMVTRASHHESHVVNH